MNRLLRGKPTSRRRPSTSPSAFLAARPVRTLVHTSNRTAQCWSKLPWRIDANRLPGSRSAAVTSVRDHVSGTKNHVRYHPPATAATVEAARIGPSSKRRMSASNGPITVLLIIRSGNTMLSDRQIRTVPSLHSESLRFAHIAATSHGTSRARMRYATVTMSTGHSSRHFCRQ